MSVFSSIETFIETEWAKIFGTTEATLGAAIINDVNLIGSGLSGGIAAFTALTGVDTASVTSLISQIEAEAAKIGADIEAEAAKPIVTQIGDYFGQLIALIPNVTGVAADLIKAVQTLLPYVEAAVGILTAGTAQGAATVAAAQAAGLSEDEARLILAGAHA